ncbi:MAG: EpsG family protein [Gemmiger sp.]|uniref:EpsG family protein n=1 Tax=Gemmiger sp. TaxID=2049027 RepID=UPI002E790C64|nr:EpsG family protein [Gemmiger sp.]MEE0799892.1 EpsG family protein [Gemmiger sp.]
MANTKERAIIDNWEFILSRWASAPVNPAPARHPARPGGGQSLASPPADAEIEEEKMTLTNYWWLLIWLAVAGIALTMLFPKKAMLLPGQTSSVGQWGWPACIILALPYVVWAMNRTNFGDTEVYRQIFADVPSNPVQLPEYLMGHTKDQGFSVLTCIVKIFVGQNDHFFFFLIAAFQMFCVIWFFRRYSNYFLLTFFMFVASTDYLSWMFNGIRQFIAVCIVLLSYKLILRKRYLPAILVILLAATIHGSALLMIPVIFAIQGKAWNKKTLLILGVILIATLFIDNFTSILDTVLAETQYSDMITNEIWTTDDGTNVFRILFYSIPAVIALVGKRYLDEADDPAMNIFANCAVVTSAFYILSGATSGIYIGRLPIYTTLPGYVVCPWLIDRMFTKDSARLVRFGLVAGYLAFFYYQMHMAWNLI